MKVRQMLMMFTLLSAATACGAAPRPFPEAVQQIDAMMTKATTMGVFRGTVLIAKDGQEYLKKGYGNADTERGIPNTPLTRFRLASITKQVTAAAVLLLEAEGMLTVQDQIGKFIDGCPAEWRAITLHQVLSHTEGIRELPEFPPSVERSLALMMEKPLQFTPGARWSYGNSGYILLGVIIEKVAREPYESFVKRRFFELLDMTGTGFDDGGIDIATAYAGKTAKADASALSFSFAAGALCSTVEDLYRWDQALWSGRVIPQSALERMLTAHAAMPPETNVDAYGYGTMLRSAYGHPLVFHPGQSPGVSTMLARYPKDDLTIIILSNQSGDPGMFLRSMEKLMFADP